MNWLKLKNHLDKYLPPVYVTLAMIAGFYVGTHADVRSTKARSRRSTCSSLLA